MPKIAVQQSHALPLDEVKRRMEEVQADLTQKYGLKFNWKSDTLLQVSGKGVEGDITVSTSSVDVKLDLSFLLTPLKGKIEGALVQQLQDKLK